MKDDIITAGCKDNFLEILYSCSETYCQRLGVSITSLFESNKSVDGIIVYIALAPDVSQLNRKRLVELGSQYCRDVIFIDVTALDEEFDRLELPKYNNNYSPWYKVLAGNTIEFKSKNYIYIDAKSIVLGNLSPLSAFDLDGKTIGGVADFIENVYLTSTKYNGDSYVNTGFMVINQKTYKESNFYSRFLQKLKELKPVLSKPAKSRNGINSYYRFDQDIINQHFSSEIAKIPLNYSVYPNLYSCNSQDYLNILIDRSAENFYSVEEIEDAKNNPIVARFPDYGTYWWKYYRKYKKMSPWKNDPIDIPVVRFTKLKRVIGKLILPSSKVAQIMHDSIKTRAK